MKKLWFILAALLILVPLGLWRFSPEQVIMRRTKHLMDVLTITQGSGGTIRRAKVFSMNAMLAPEVELESPDIQEANGNFDNEELESAFSWICQNSKCSELNVTQFRSVEVKEKTAKVRVVVEGYLELPTYRPADGSFEVAIDWIRADDGWRFKKVVWKNR